MKQGLFHAEKIDGLVLVWVSMHGWIAMYTFHEFLDHVRGSFFGDVDEDSPCSILRFGATCISYLVMEGLHDTLQPSKFCVDHCTIYPPFLFTSLLCFIEMISPVTATPPLLP